MTVTGELKEGKKPLQLDDDEFVEVGSYIYRKVLGS